MNISWPPFSWSIFIRAVRNHMICYNLNWPKMKIFVHYLAFSCAFCHILKSWKCMYTPTSYKIWYILKELYVTGYVNYKLACKLNWPAESNLGVELRQLSLSQFVYFLSTETSIFKKVFCKSKHRTNLSYPLQQGSATSRSYKIAFHCMPVAFFGLHIRKNVGRGLVQSFNFRRGTVGELNVA